MCMTPFSPQGTMTTPYPCASRHPSTSCNCVEQAGDRQQPLRMQWVVETDEQGIQRLRMRWTVPSPRNSDRATRPRRKRAVCRIGASAAGPRTAVAIP